MAFLEDHGRVPREGEFEREAELRERSRHPPPGVQGGAGGHRGGALGSGPAWPLRGPPGLPIAFALSPPAEALRSPAHPAVRHQGLLRQLQGRLRASRPRAVFDRRAGPDQGRDRVREGRQADARLALRTHLRPLSLAERPAGARGLRAGAPRHGPRCDDRQVRPPAPSRRLSAVPRLRR